MRARVIAFSWRDRCIIISRRIIILRSRRTTRRGVIMTSITRQRNKHNVLLTRRRKIEDSIEFALAKQQRPILRLGFRGSMDTSVKVTGITRKRASLRAILDIKERQSA